MRGIPCPAQNIQAFCPAGTRSKGYGNFGFSFGGMSHRGSILALPSGIYAWDVLGPEDLGVGALAQVLAEPKGEIEHLLVGTGRGIAPPWPGSFERRSTPPAFAPSRWQRAPRRGPIRSCLVKTAASRRR